jgi:hypothetical protein
MLKKISILAVALFIFGCSQTAPIEFIAPCTLEVMYPESLVKMLRDCKNTGRWEHCGSGGHCPAICNLARSVEKPYIDKLYEPYNKYGGSLVPFSRGKDYGLVFDQPYETAYCPNKPADHSCELDICALGMF